MIIKLLEMYLNDIPQSLIDKIDKYNSFELIKHRDIIYCIFEDSVCILNKKGSTEVKTTTIFDMDILSPSKLIKGDKTLEYFTNLIRPTIIEVTKDKIRYKAESDEALVIEIKYDYALNQFVFSNKDLLTGIYPKRVKEEALEFRTWRK